MIGVVSWEHTIKGKKADMGPHPLIKVIKRVERERAVQEAVESTSPTSLRTEIQAIPQLVLQL
jgi:hypothetical protein